MSLLLNSVIPLSLVVRVLLALLPLPGVPPGITHAPVGATVRELSTLRSLMMTLQVLMIHPMQPGVTLRFALTPELTASLRKVLRT